jgi:hypothetical protein
MLNGAIGASAVAFLLRISKCAMPLAAVGDGEVVDLCLVLPRLLAVYDLPCSMAL